VDDQVVKANPLRKRGAIGMNTEPTMTDEPAEQYLTVVSLDIERFSRFTDPEKTEIASLFRNAVHRAFDRADLLHVYMKPRFLQNTGDGQLAGYPQEELGPIVDRIPSILQGELRELHRSKKLCVRMRMGVSVGPVDNIKDKRVDVSPGQIVIDACRIADADATRRLLEQSDPNATYLAMAVTPTVLETTVMRKPLWLTAGEFAEVDITIEKKKYRTTAYLHVPSPSGELLRSGLVNLVGPTEDAETRIPLEERLCKRKHVDNSVGGDLSTGGGQSNQVGSVGRDIRDESIKADVSGKGAVGGVRGNVNIDNSEDHRGQDRSTRTVVHGDNISANRDANVTKFDRNHGDEEKHAPFWKRGDQS
jgi:hypothetical protein